MHVTRYVDELRQELLLAAEAGGEDARALAERLTAPLESAARLGLLEALSDAAAEITRELAPGSVEVRLRGRDPQFVVNPAPAPDGAPPLPPDGVPAAEGTGDTDAVPNGSTAYGTPEAAATGAEEGPTTRTTLRLPEHLKVRMDQAAAAEGISVNAWLVRAVGAALDGPATAPRLQSSFGAQRWTGWAR